MSVDPDGYVFSTSPTGRDPWLPETVTGRVRQLSRRLGVKVTLRSLRHYAATEMLTNGDGGTTTLKVYTHFLPAPDLRAAQILANSAPRPGQNKA